MAANTKGFATSPILWLFELKNAASAFKIPTLLCRYVREHKVLRKKKNPDNIYQFLVGNRKSFIAILTEDSSFGRDKPTTI